MSLLSSRRAATLGVTGALAAGALALALPAGANSVKPAPQVPAAALVAPSVTGMSAASTSHTGTPSFRAVSMASQDGTCDIGDLCLYYLTSQSGYGSGYDTAHNDPNLFNNHFIFAGSGQGSTVGSNAEAYWNRDPHTYAYVCTGLKAKGTCGFLTPNTFGNLNSTFSNRSQSVKWGDSTN